MEDNLNVNEEEVPLVEQNSPTGHEEPDLVNQIMPFFKKGEAALLREIKKFNDLENLFLRGEYSKNREKNFGFFMNVRHYEGKKIYYPILDGVINKIFIAPNTLSHGGTYTFEVKIAKRTRARSTGKSIFIRSQN